MKPQLELTAIFEPVEEGWVQARIREIPAVVTAGRTQEEAEELLLDALKEYLLSLSSDSPDREDSGHSHPLEVRFAVKS